MDITPQPYTFTTADCQRIEAWGYSFDNNEDLITFMQTGYPNFNLAALLSVVEELFPPTTALTIRRLIRFNNSTMELLIHMQNTFTDAADALVFKRVFDHTQEGISVKHEYCVVPTAHQQQGLIKRVFQESLQQYINMGLKTIMVHAGLTAGGYAWARHGFVAIDPQEVDIILEGARKRLISSDFEFVEEIYNSYYNRNPSGTEFPMILWARLPFMKEVLAGSDWHGVVNLQNPEQFRNFKDYVFRT